MKRVSLITGWICVPLVASLFFIPVRVEAHFGQKPHKEDVHEIIRQELERHRVLVGEWKERYNREYEARKGVEAQLEKLRSAVAKAAKL